MDYFANICPFSYYIFMESFHSALEKVRIQRALGRYELAAACEVSPVTIRQALDGLAAPRTQRKIAEKLGFESVAEMIEACELGIIAESQPSPPIQTAA